MSVNATLEAVARRDRLVVVTALTTVIALSWMYLLAGAGMGMSAFEMTHMSQLGVAEAMPARGMADMAMMTPAVWTPGYAVLMFFMWWVMMVAMMLPSATPMILLHAMVNRKVKLRDGEEYGPWSTASFTLGYVLAWAAFSAVAIPLQWVLEITGMLSPMMMNSINTIFTGLLLLFAGMYQLIPIKQACLKHCRHPIEFLSCHWRPGSKGALIMGAHHGVYCLGCCWGLMFILFFVGVMNLYWIVGLALIVLIEKLTPFGRQLSWITGALLFAWGASFLYRVIA